jgi:flagellar motility protein MotE (MotC chaperone)
MKTGVMAIVVFVAAFILTTAALIFLNTQFMNIFKFDFRAVHISQEAAKTDSTAIKDSTLNKQNVVNDSTKALDSLKSITQNLNPIADSSKVAEQKDVKTEEKTDPKNADNTTAPAQNNAAASKPQESNAANQGFVSGDVVKMDPVAYTKWKKNMAGIMEIMDSKKASQILRTYSDNIARDIFFTMKKKKAAEILSRYDIKSDSLMIRKLTRMQ